MQRYNDDVTDQFGNAIEDATITVRIAATPAASGAVASLFSDNLGTVVLANPMTTDKSGMYGFYAADGDYDVTVSGISGVAAKTITIHLEDYTKTLTSQLASILANFGASLIGIYDSAANYVSTTVEGALAEIWTRLASTASPTLGDYLVGVKRTNTGATATTLHSFIEALPLSVMDFGAVGDGTDDTAAFTAAAATGKSFTLTPGLTYLTGPFTLSTAGQGVIAWGATVKLKAASANTLCKLNASGCWVEGGTWDVNNIAQTGIQLSADYCMARFTTLQNCGAAGIYGSNNANYLTISNNVIKDAVTYGIYVECLTADAYGNKILDNQIDTSATASASGIYLTGTNAETFFQRQWQVRGNRCNGSVSTPTAPGLTVRAVDGVCAENHVVGYTLGITADITSRSVISNNRVEGVLGSTGYNIEVNGHHNIISGNYTKAGKYSLVLTSSTDDLSHNTISGNSFENPTVNAILISGTGGKTARYGSIVGNNIDMSDASAGVRAIYLTGDCIHTHISGNNILGRGSGTSNTRAVYLDTPPAAAFISIVNNKFAGFERACGVFSSGALTVTDLTSNGNDVSSDVSQSTVFWNFETSATVGTRVNHTNSKNANGSYQDVHDMLLNVFTLRSTSFNSPEAGLTAGIGSLYISLNSGQVPYIKSTGANTNTGWVAL